MNRILLEVRVDQAVPARRGRRGRAAAPVRHPLYTCHGHPRGARQQGLLRLPVETGRVRREEERQLLPLRACLTSSRAWRWFRPPCATTPTGRWLRTSWAGVGQINAEEIADTKRYKDDGPNDLTGRPAWRSSTSGSCGARRGKQKFLTNSTRRSFRQLGDTPRVPVTTWRCRSASTCSGSPNRRSATASRARGGLRRLAGAAGYRKADSGVVIVVYPTTAHQGARVMARTRPLMVRPGCRRSASPTCSGSAPVLPRSPCDRVSFAPGSMFEPFIAFGRSSTGSSFSSYYPAPRKHLSRRMMTDVPQLDHRQPLHHSVEQALKVSCDMVFDQIGADFDDRERHRLGKDVTLPQESLR